MERIGMKKPFAKLIPTETTDVLVFFSRDDETGVPKIFRWLNLNGMEVGVHLSWDDDTDESWGKAQRCFDEFDEAKAIDLVTAVRINFGDISVV